MAKGGKEEQRNHKGGEALHGSACMYGTCGASLVLDAHIHEHKALAKVVVWYAKKSLVFQYDLRPLNLVPSFPAHITKCASVCGLDNETET